GSKVVLGAPPFAHWLSANDLAHLDLRRPVGVTGHVGKDFLPVRGHSVLEVGQRLEGEVADAHERRGGQENVPWRCAQHKPGQGAPLISPDPRL
ncbi:hypothetical protein MYX04_13265, partial [Nitrospiraceae bacterium AH_259_D15_M11_P09]|nr:hypothetical protein [Nitrospiraceae bacterium AH_259_D15_M11_P09]